MARFIWDNPCRYGLRKVRDNIHVPNYWYQQLPQKNTDLIPPAPKISILPTLQISKPVPNVLTTDMRNSWTNHRCAEFQILDWNSNFQSPLARTTDKLLQNFTHKKPFTIKFIYENIVYYKISFIKILFIMNVTQNTDSNCPLVIFLFLLFCPHNSFLPFLFSPSLRYNITHYSNHNFF